jgi:hypothetical protein
MKSLRLAFVAVALFAVSAAAEDAAVVDYEPIHPKELIALMPKAAAGFKAAKAQGTMSGELGSKITIVSRVYTYSESSFWGEDEEAPKPTLTIKMTDSVTNKSFPLMYNKIAEMGQSATSGFSNAISLDGHPAIKNYREKDQVGTLSVYVADRFMVQIVVKGLPEETMMEWWEKINTKKLAKLAVFPTATPASTPTHTLAPPEQTQTPAKAP